MGETLRERAQAKRIKQLEIGYDKLKGVASKWKQRAEAAENLATQRLARIEEESRLSVAAEKALAERGHVANCNCYEHGEGWPDARCAPREDEGGRNGL